MIVTFYLPYGTVPDEQKRYAEIQALLVQYGAQHQGMATLRETTGETMLYRMTVDRTRIEATLKKVPGWVRKLLLR